MTPTTRSLDDGPQPWRPGLPVSFRRLFSAPPALRWLYPAVPGIPATAPPPATPGLAPRAAS